MRFFLRVREFKLARFNPIYSSTIRSEPDQTEFSLSWDRSFAGVTFFFPQIALNRLNPSTLFTIRIEPDFFPATIGLSRITSNGWRLSNHFCGYQFNPGKATRVFCKFPSQHGLRLMSSGARRLQGYPPLAARPVPWNGRGQRLVNLTEWCYSEGDSQGLPGWIK